MRPSIAQRPHHGEGRLARVRPGWRVVDVLGAQLYFCSPEEGGDNRKKRRGGTYQNVARRSGGAVVSPHGGGDERGEGLSRVCVEEEGGDVSGGTGTGTGTVSRCRFARARDDGIDETDENNRGAKKKNRFTGSDEQEGARAQVYTRLNAVGADSPPPPVAWRGSSSSCPP